MKTEITKETITFLGKRLNELTESEKDDMIIYLATEWEKYKSLYFDGLKQNGLGISK